MMRAFLLVLVLVACARGQTTTRSGDRLAFVRERGLPTAWHEHRNEIVVEDVGTFLAEARTVLSLTGKIEILRFAVDGSVAFQHIPERGERRLWLLHLATGVVRPIDRDDREALRAASRPAAARPELTIDDSPMLGVEVLPTQEPETETSGFFSIDAAGGEHRAAYEDSNWDDLRHAEEARVHKRLLDRFVAGVQWPFRREAGYEPFFGPDDMPLRAGRSIPHLGLDIGARLVHTASATVGFHVAGTAVHPLYGGGFVSLGRIVVVRDGKLPGSTQYPVLQEVELREAGYLLRIHINYEHVRSVKERARAMKAEASSGPTPVTADDEIGDLVPYDASSPSGGWITSDPALLAAGVGKGNHIHVGTGGIYRSFNGSQEAGGRKLRWYQERLLPALNASRGPVR